MAGHLRTWNYCKEYIVRTLDMLIPDSKDWYVAFWESTTSSEIEIYNFLKNSNQNIVKVKSYNYEENRSLPYGKFDFESSPVGVPVQFLTSAYLRNYMGLEKKLYEYKNNIRYDIVFNIRPDIIYATSNDTKRYFDLIINTEFQNFGLQITGDYIADQNIKLGGPSVNDLLQITGFLSSDIYSLLYITMNRYNGVFQRSYMRGGNCTHAVLPQYLINHIIHSRKIDWLHRDRDIFLAPKLIRPNVPFDDIENQLRIWDSWCVQYHLWGEKYEREWNKLSIDDKRHICIKMNIDPSDYNL